MAEIASTSIAQPVYLVNPADGAGYAGTVPKTYQLASNQTIAANSGTTPITNVQGGSYLFDVQFTGTSVRLETLGADGTTWRPVTTSTTSGTTGVVIGQGATVRLYNPNGTSVTGVYANLT